MSDLMREDCQTCDGTGKEIPPGFIEAHKCPDCDGRGWNPTQQAIEAIAIPRHQSGRPKCYESPKDDSCYCWINAEADLIAVLIMGDTE